MSVPDADDDPLVLLMQLDEFAYHVLVALVDEDALDGGVAFPDFFDVGREVVLVVLEFLFDAFPADEEPCEAGQHEFEFFGHRHGAPHGVEELLRVGVDEGDRERVGLGVGDRGEHLIACMNAVLFRHVFLELCEEPVDEREVLACLFVGLWLGLSQDHRLVALLVELDADDIWVDRVEDRKKRVSEVKDMPGADESDHVVSLFFWWKCAGV